MLLLLLENQNENNRVELLRDRNEFSITRKMEDNRPTKEVVSLIDIDDEMPRFGEKVYALGLGGALCEVVWGRNSHEFFKAWMPYPKVPKAVKEKLYNLYCNGGWKLNAKFERPESH